VLLAAVHYLLLEGHAHPLADVYAGRSDLDPAPLFHQVCLDRRAELADLLTVRRVQTNDCGRTALLGPGLTWIAGRRQGPLALVDVGASAGLNLIGDRYRLDYGAFGATGPPGSPVEVRCRVTGGRPPLAPVLPDFAVRVGLDRAPVDLSDPDDARWLLACVWPDTGRLDRTAASIRLAQESPPLVREGDAIADLPELLDDLGDTTEAVVMNSWSYSYFSPEQRTAYVDRLAAASRRRPVAWLVADDGSTIAELPALPDEAAGDHVLAAVVFEDGRATTARLLAAVHQHGAWLDWLDPEGPP
jgi:hypothetical protein